MNLPFLPSVNETISFLDPVHKNFKTDQNENNGQLTDRLNPSG